MKLQNITEASRLPQQTSMWIVVVEYGDTPSGGEETKLGPFNTKKEAEDFAHHIESVAYDHKVMDDLVYVAGVDEIKSPKEIIEWMKKYG